MELSEKQLNLIRKINLHIKDVLPSYDNIWEEVSLEFPQYVEHDIKAYRADVNTHLDVFNSKMWIKNPHISWSYSIEGVVYFLELMEDDPEFTFIFSTAYIKAFNLGKFAKDLKSQDALLTFVDHALKEDELICLEYLSSIEESKILSLHELKKMRL